MNVLGGCVMSNPGPGGLHVSQVSFALCDFVCEDVLPPTLYADCHFDRCRFTMTREATMIGGFPGGYFQDCVFGVDPEAILATQAELGV